MNEVTVKKILKEKQYFTVYIKLVFYNILITYNNHKKRDAVHDESHTNALLVRVDISIRNC